MTAMGGAGDMATGLAASWVAQPARPMSNEPNVPSNAQRTKDAGVFIIGKETAYRQSREARMDIIGKRMFILASIANPARWIESAAASDGGSNLALAAHEARPA